MAMIFQLANLFVMPFWLLMIALPHWRWTKRIIGSLWLIVPLAALYSTLLLPASPALLPALLNPTVTGIATLLGQPEGTTIAWVHFLAFDLFVGRWAYLDSRSRKLSAWLVSPILVLIFMAGPLGFLLYFGLRMILPLSSGEE